MTDTDKIIHGLMVFKELPKKCTIYACQDFLEVYYYNGKSGIGKRNEQRLLAYGWEKSSQDCYILDLYDKRK